MWNKTRSECILRPLLSHKWKIETLNTLKLRVFPDISFKLPCMIIIYILELNKHCCTFVGLFVESDTVKLSHSKLSGLGQLDRIWFQNKTHRAWINNLIHNIRHDHHIHVLPVFMCSWSWSAFIVKINQWLFQLSYISFNFWFVHDLMFYRYDLLDYNKEQKKKEKKYIRGTYVPVG